MSSQLQIEANRRNAQFSRGPRTAAGKLRSRRNALKHGLTAATVIRIFERNEDYEALERAILADYEPSSIVETELVMRLASLLWRLRRAVTVETGLIHIHGEIQIAIGGPESELRPKLETRADGASDFGQVNGSGRPRAVSESNANAFAARCFLRVTDYDRGLFEKIGRYEKALWQQARELIALIDRIRQRADAR